jgi:hypothetical protein
LRVRSAGNRRSIELDGELAAEVDVAGRPAGQPRSIGVLDSGRPVEFANFYIRPLR